MILTGDAISQAVEDGDIVIDPFDPTQVNPNSYNYRLGSQIYRVRPGESPDSTISREELVPQQGRHLLEKGNLYLGHTVERLGSHTYVTSLIGRSSIGRLGLFVQLSANLGHCGAIHRWTLELMPTISIYVYPGQIIGQVSFWSIMGEIVPYEGWYGRHHTPMPSKLHEGSPMTPTLGEDSDSER